MQAGTGAPGRGLNKAGAEPTDSGALGWAWSGELRAWGQEKLPEGSRVADPTPWGKCFKSSQWGEITGEEAAPLDQPPGRRGAEEGGGQGEPHEKGRGVRRATGRGLSGGERAAVVLGTGLGGHPQAGAHRALVSAGPGARPGKEGGVSTPPPKPSKVYPQAVNTLD